MGQLFQPECVGWEKPALNHPYAEKRGHALFFAAEFKEDNV